MQDGKIAQIDETQALFRKPATTWVAELVGYANTLTGRVLRREDDWALVQTGQNSLWAQCRDGAMAVGDAAQVMFQPRGCQLIRQQTPATGNLNALPVQVEQQVFEGHGWRIHCLHGAHSLQVHDTRPYYHGADMLGTFENAATHAYRAEEPDVDTERASETARIA